MTRDEQFKIIEAARTRMFDRAQTLGIPLHVIEYVVPFVPTDFSLNVFFFLKTDQQVREARSAKRQGEMSAEFVKILRSLGYSEEWLTQISFEFDSDENVQRHYQGSYFHRMRG